ncbi:LapA family protein [Paracoccus salipaludis]|uniref:DUF1049 domain-containing protein n=1 Tax=Paracoccus salipaludis TaxID=2032623 RepID=A0A2A2GLH2_9RHOB|nr:LapA family protein [Paracoccus salipaludis]PAU97864.1 DUF1049 domain-containing protein [Paracoccus salipaludis]
MRYVRMLLVALLAIILVGVALANRQLVTVSLFPGRLDRYMGGDWQVQMPLFLVIILALLAGMILGLIWEWMRETAVRQESARRAHDLQVLEREVRGLRVTHHAPRDEVLAILDAPKPGPAPAPTPAAANTALPATSATLPARR